MRRDDRITTVARRARRSGARTAFAAGPAQAASARRRHTGPSAQRAHLCAAPAGYAACLARVVVNSRAPRRRSPGSRPMPRRPATARPTSSRPTTCPVPPAPARPWPSSTPTTTRPPSRTSRPTARPTACPPARSGNGCFSKVDQNGGTELPGDRRRLGDRDQPGPRHGVGGLPELQHPARRGRLGVLRQPRHRRGHRGQSRARSRSATATAAATAAHRPTTTIPASRSPRRPVTAATASSRRPASTPSSPSAAPA